MFDNTKPNIIILSDYSHPVFLQRTLGVTKVADGLRKAGYEVLVINHLHTFSIDELEDVFKKTISNKTLFVGINSMFYQHIESTQVIADNDNPWEQGGIKFGAKESGSFLPHGKKYNSVIKNLVTSLSPNCKFVLGGPDAQDVECNSDYDYVVRGMADLSIVNLANHLAFGEPLEKNRRSIFKFTVLDDIAAAGYDFVGTQMAYHEHDIILPGESLPIEIGRGCIFSCKFCSYPLNGKKKNDYVKHEDVLYAEFLDNYEKFGTTRYVFADDTFNDSKEKLEAIYRISKKLPFKLEYWAFIRLDLLAANPETIDLLYGSGCIASFFGIETLNQKAAAFIGKGGSREKLLVTIKNIKAKWGNSVTLHGGFIFGLPKEDISSMKETAAQLLNGDTGLDSWFTQSLIIRPSETYAFNSDIDTNYMKYGYTITGFDDELKVATWKNEYTDFYECKELADELHQESIKRNLLTIRGIDVFFVSSLGIDLNAALNKPIQQFNWHQAELKKADKAKEYKEALYKQINRTS